MPGDRTLVYLDLLTLTVADLYTVRKTLPPCEQTVHKKQQRQVLCMPPLCVLTSWPLAAPSLQCKGAFRLKVEEFRDSL